MSVRAVSAGSAVGFAAGWNIADIGAVADLRLVLARGTAFTPDPLPPLAEMDEDSLPPAFRHPGDPAWSADPVLRHDGRRG